MKEFLKYTFATVAGIVITGVALFIIGLIILISVAASKKSTTHVSENSVMCLDVSGSLSERVNDNPLNSLKIFNDKFDKYGLDDILSSIDKAKKNPDIKGIYIIASHLSDASYGSIQEIRNALSDFKKSGKFVVAYSDGYTQKMYYLCSVANKVELNPQGSLEWKGLCVQYMFYKDLLAKLGVKMQVFRVGTYKSAVEPYILNKMSDANRAQSKDMISQIWKQILNDVSQSRNLSVQKLNEYADNGLMFQPAEAAVKDKMIDGTARESDMPDIIKSMMHIRSSQKVQMLSLDDMVNVETKGNSSGNKIAVYYAFGDIGDGKKSSTDDDGIYANDMVDDLKKLTDDDDIKAVVLRVNSPGGSAFASDQIWDAINKLKKKKPVIVSMGDYAASGGYYISCGANAIVAQPTTLTGSIGIFGLIPEASSLTKKIGVSFDNVKTNKLSDFGDISRGMNTEEQTLLQMEINRGYQTFLSRCAHGRKRTASQINAIGQGRVWTGAEALKLGLVDRLGGLHDAIALAAKTAHLKDFETESYPEKESFLSSLLSNETTKEIKTSIIKSELGEYFTTLGIINRVQNHIDGIQARLPYNMTIR
jgi:protease IV